MQLLKNKRIVVMGLLNTESIAWTIGQRAQAEGATIIYTVQNERYKETILLRSFRRQGLDVNDYKIYGCDIEIEEDIQRLFKKTGKIDGIVYSIAYAARECLEGNLWDAGRSQVLKSLNISAVGLAYVVQGARERLRENSSVVALTFESQKSFPGYNWMGVSKAALEATVRGLARDLGLLGHRVNCLSSGPLETKAASSVPGFSKITDAWKRAPLGWDLKESRESVAGGAVYLLSDLSKSLTGTILCVDGGFSAMAI